MAQITVLMYVLRVALERSIVTNQAFRVLEGFIGTTSGLHHVS